MYKAFKKALEDANRKKAKEIVTDVLDPNRVAQVDSKEIPTESESVLNKGKDEKGYTHQPKITAFGTKGDNTKEFRSAKQIKPKNVIPKTDKKTAPKLGDRIIHNKISSVGRSGASIYNDPKTWESEGKGVNKLKAFVSRKKQ